MFTFSFVFRNAINFTLRFILFIDLNYYKTGKTKTQILLREQTAN